MATNGKVEVLSRPSILARNNQEAVIVVGQEVPFITNSRITDDGQTINTIQYDNIGIILRVTPFITSDGMVEMIVAPEISTLTDRTVPISNNAAAPVIAKRSAETVVVTPNGATAVIGGLMETQRIEAVRKIPLLGDIPILGIPFRRTVKDDVKKELMIFLTPHIISRPNQVEELAATEIARTELVEKAFTESEMEKYFESPLELGKDSAGNAVQIRRASPVSPVNKVTVRETETTVTTPVTVKETETTVTTPVQPEEAILGAPKSAPLKPQRRPAN
jgi:general secretion pathway protein D